jgi:RHS repeat-associated protein
VDKTRLHGPRGPEYERVGSASPSWYVYDGLGSVVATVDATGAVTSARKYDVYGSVSGLTGQSGTKHKFVGSLGHPSEDETGLVYMRARYYDPVLGRFASEDPAENGINWFAYADGAPTDSADPTGKFSTRGTRQLAMGGLAICLLAFTVMVATLRYAVDRGSSPSSAVVAPLIGLVFVGFGMMVAAQLGSTNYGFGNNAMGAFIGGIVGTLFDTVVLWLMGAADSAHQLWGRVGCVGVLASEFMVAYTLKIWVALIGSYVE